MDRIHVFIGTKAQYIKTAPLLRLMDARGVDYRLIDSGQHAALSVGMRRDLGVREPDHVMGGDRDIATIPQALAWSAGIAGRLVSRSRVNEVFAGDGGICVVHGDTPSTLLSTLMARRAGLEVAHLEAGLRSYNLLNPFPEEAIRVVVMRAGQILFAPDATAEESLRRMGLADRCVRLEANTSVEAVAHALCHNCSPAAERPAVVTMHRVENLHRPGRVRAFAAIARRIARDRRVTFLVHGPTRPVLERQGLTGPLEADGVELRDLVPHDAFVRLCHDAPLVVTDGGSIQEECALLGVPTLLWRRHTERPDGLGRNVVLSRYDRETVRRFLADPEAYRHPPADLSARPSEKILTTLLEHLGLGRAPRKNTT